MAVVGATVGVGTTTVGGADEVVGSAVDVPSAQAPTTRSAIPSQSRFATPPR